MMTRSTIAVLHYTAPPVIGGVESVLDVHARLFLQAGFEVVVIVGRGAAAALPKGVQFQLIPELDSLHPRVAAMSAALELGCVPADFGTMATGLAQTLAPILSRCDHVIVHNVFTKHFNLPLTAALFDLLDAHGLRQCIAWCHDFTWASTHSRSKVHPGYPWNLLRTRRCDVNYVVVSRERQHALAQLFHCAPALIQVIYNGVDPAVLLGLSANGRALIERLGVRDGDLILLMPVRITTAKNIELALQVTAVLKARGCQPRLVITGPPDPHDRDSLVYLQLLRKLRRQLDVESDARFVFESGSDSTQPCVIDEQLVAELLRVSDVLFMPSQREGFGMPILEAGLIGIPVVCTNSVPAAQEIGGEDVVRFDANDSPEFIADLIQARTQHSPAQRLRRRIKQDYSWPAIFRREIAPLLAKGRRTV
jgi:glycosyltransferase involved in cell wall biosynthesis